MKNILLAFLLIAFPCASQADNLIQNGDFSQGAAHWLGDGLTPQAYVQANPKAPQTILTNNCLVVKLDPSCWTRVYQSFPSDQTTMYSIAVTYRLSPDMAISQDPNMYLAINKKMQLPGFDHFGVSNGKPGDFYGTVGDLRGKIVAWEVYQPKLGTGAVQLYTHNYPAISPLGTKTFALAFPPGTGVVVLLKAVVTSK